MEIKKENGKIYSPIRNKMLVCTPEEEVRQGFICTLVNEYGYSIEQMDEEIQVNNSQRGQGRSRADIVVWKSKEDKETGKAAFIVVECKAENVKIHEEDYFQGYNYAAWAGASFFITTNNRETKFFNVDRAYMPKKLNEIVTIPKADEVNNEKRVKEILEQEKKFTQDEFTQMLLKCHNIIRNNDKLSPEAAFDEISKILFMKIRFERAKKKEGKRFTVDEYESQKKIEASYNETHHIENPLPFMQVLFNDTKKDFKKDNLFESSEIIKIRETSFISILKLLEKYNLNDTSKDVKGIAFEQFLGRTFRGELGQFFTPRTIVDFMTGVLDPQEGELICDPCCGSGGFLIKAFEYVREKIERDIQEKKDKFKAEIMSQYPEDMTEQQQIEFNERLDSIYKKLDDELKHVHNETDKRDFYSRLDTLSYKSIYGTDANPRMARTSKMNMIMHGDGHGGVHHHDGLININGIFEGRFDVILTNPPFGSSVAKDQYIEVDDIDHDYARIEEYTSLYGDAYKTQLQDLQRRANIVVKDGSDKKLKAEKSLLNMYDTGKMSSLTEVLFIERCLRLLKPGGRMGIVLPEGVLNNSNLQAVREYFEGKAKIILICSIPQDVFIKAGATVKPSLVFFKKFTEEETQQYAACVDKATCIVNNTYHDELEELECSLSAKSITKKDYTAKKKQLDAKMVEEIKSLVKEMFDYQIPIAKVEKAGITTTGTECDNELIQVLQEYAPYRKANSLWQENTLSFDYTLSADGKITRISDDEATLIGE